MNNKTVRVICAAALVFSAFVFPAAAKETRVTRFANSRTAFSLPALKSDNEARVMLEKRKQDIRVVLQSVGWTGNLDDLLKAAEIGTFTETTITPGTRLPYIAMRRAGKPAVLQEVVWAGKEPVSAYVLEFESNGHRHRLTIPKPCSNLWVEDLGPVGAPAPPPPRAAVQIPDVQVCVTQAASVSVNVQNAPGAQVVLMTNGKQVAAGTAVSGAFRAELPGFASPGAYQVDASVGDVHGSGTITVVPCPPVCALKVTPAEVKSGQEAVIDASGSQVNPQWKGSLKQVRVTVSRDGAEQEPVTLTGNQLSTTVQYKKAGTYTFRATAEDDAGQASTNSCEGTLLVTKPPMGLFFMDVLGGKERMIRDEFPKGRCAGLAGVKLGILPRLGEHAEVEAAVGGKLNFRDTDNSAVFADLAINGVFSKGFIGGGVSFWDLNLTDTR
ncbi:MAG TPA: hypothetical protein VLR94_05895, partial [Acidobacteriota bacterium]|nr:hypothetical protein [Acidobacteriota bacterium]